MNYMILIYESEAGRQLRNDPQRAPAYWAAWPAYTKTLQDAGVMVGGAGLELPDTATTLRIKSGKRQVQDGPFADTKEQLGGFYIIDVPNLNAALDWAAKVPVAEGSALEVRPVMKTPN